jgi:hypothetical protein
MKVISIIQPWATLIALGEKKFETRSWKTKYRGELAIHASKKIDKEACKMTPIVQTLNKHGIVLFDDLPMGEIIATCNLIDCLQVHTHAMSEDGGYAIVGDNNILIQGNEYDFGWYGRGRFAWELQNVETLNEPIKAKGQLNLWNYQL